MVDRQEYFRPARILPRRVRRETVKTLGEPLMNSLYWDTTFTDFFWNIDDRFGKPMMMNGDIINLLLLVGLRSSRSLAIAVYIQLQIIKSIPNSFLCGGSGCMWRFLTCSAELPPVSALVTQDEGGHRLVGRARLDLVVGAVPLAALAALEQVGLGALDLSQPGAVDAFLHELLALLFDLE